MNELCPAVVPGTGYHGVLGFPSFSKLLKLFQIGFFTGSHIHLLLSLIDDGF
jgi:hypothetical protein